jgi:hypothetical protein
MLDLSDYALPILLEECKEILEVPFLTHLLALDGSQSSLFKKINSALDQPEFSSLVESPKKCIDAKMHPYMSTPMCEFTKPIRLVAIGLTMKSNE